MFQTKAMVHSLQALAEVTIISEDGPNNVVAEYQGKRCTAVFNVFQACIMWTMSTASFQNQNKE